ncbi:hypothetical protein KGA66_12165 [Actinocrinis puniceicyclus]|uniref:Uncharacterized protein n=1 Tax=Actinocrinis puniceicyclus TaxID=977794 RepID=A0A8J7WK74_9ACTN|nr:hypothetical protein [Actinocrinis puniceicyclus]MBS2963808.1 hypothetical protein [Actinocrinis puniceicyclus]
MSETHSEALAALRGFVFTMALLAVLLGGSLIAQLPARFTQGWFTPERDAYQQVWPQSWAFFAPLGGAASYTAYQLGPKDMLSRPLIMKTMSAANRWGIGHGSDVGFYEVDYLAQYIPPVDWVECPDARWAQCAQRAPIVSFRDNFTPAAVCGDVLFVRTDPDADSSKSSDSVPAGSVSVAEVSCR